MGPAPQVDEALLHGGSLADAVVAFNPQATAAYLWVYPGRAFMKLEQHGFEPFWVRMFKGLAHCLYFQPSHLQPTY